MTTNSVPSDTADNPKATRDPLHNALKRNREMEKRAFGATKSVGFLTAALVVSLIGNVIQGTHRPQPRIYAQDSVTHTLVPIVPLTEPISSRTAVTAHVAEAVASLNSIDFLNYKPQLAQASKLFTRNAWERYVAEFERVGSLAQLTKRQMVMTGAIAKPPVIEKEDIEFGVKTWAVQVPYKVQYVAAGYNQTETYMAYVKVIRVPTTDNPKGIAIAQFVARKTAADLQ